MDGTLEFLNELEDIIDNRIHQTDESASYVSKLAGAGLDRVLKKIGEEAGEVIIAAKNNHRDELLNESADLLFHLLILLRKKGTSLSDVVEILNHRHHAR